MDEPCAEPGCDRPRAPRLRTSGAGPQRCPEHRAARKKATMRRCQRDWFARNYDDEYKSVRAIKDRERRKRRPEEVK